MYKQFEHPLVPPFAGNNSLNKFKGINGVVNVNDVICFQVSEKLSFQVLEEELNQQSVKGEIVGFEPWVASSCRGWASGDKVQVSRAAITSIDRAD